VPAAIEPGSSVGAAPAAWSASPASSPDVRRVAAAPTLGAGAGGEVARAVDGVAATLRERHELRAEVRALATQARASAAVLAAAPLLFAGLVATLEPHAIAFLVTTPAGLACLASGLGLEILGVGWMARITRSAG
jgi:tight adherence protein B